MKFAPSPPHLQPLAFKDRISFHFVDPNNSSGFFPQQCVRKEVCDKAREEKRDKRVLFHKVKKEKLRCIKIHNHPPAAALYCNYWGDYN